MKEINFILEDIPEINKLFGLRGTLRAQIELDNKKVEAEFFFKSSFAEEEVDANYARPMIMEILQQRGITTEYLQGLKEDCMHNLTIPEQSLMQKDIFLVFSTDQWQTNDSYELENITSSIEKAHETTKTIFAEYGDDIKVVIRKTKLDAANFEDFEVYSKEHGLEWKKDDSDTEYGYLSAGSENNKGATDV